MKLEIEQFMTDSRRPDWLIRLLYEVRTYCPAEGAISWIEAIMRDTTLVRRTKVYPLTECVRWEVTDDSLTIYSLFKDRPIVEFTLNSEDPNGETANRRDVARNVSTNNKNKTNFFKSKDYGQNNQKGR